MELKKIEKIHTGKFINRYNLTYLTSDSKEKVYEMISRNKNITSIEDLQKKKADAVVMIMHSADGEKLLLNKEFRLAIGDWVYNFPAGLIDPGEAPEISAARELKEETGLDLIEIKDIMRLSYSAIGFSNESNLCIVGTADGSFSPSTSTVEEIEAAWYTREDVRRLLAEKNFAARTQSYCYLWSKE